MISTRSQSSRSAERKTTSSFAPPRLAGSEGRACAKLHRVGSAEVACSAIDTPSTTTATATTTAIAATTATGIATTNAIAATTATGIATTNAHATATAMRTTTTKTTTKYRSASGNKVRKTIEETSDGSVAPVIVQGPSSVMITTPAQRKVTSRITWKDSEGRQRRMRVIHRQMIEVKRWKPDLGLSRTAPTLVFKSVK